MGGSSSVWEYGNQTQYSIITAEALTGGGQEGGSGGALFSAVAVLEGAIYDRSV